MSELKEYVDRIADELIAVYDGRAESDDGERATFWDYFEDVLDIEYRIDGQLRYKGVSLAVTLGGPNIWVDTWAGEVRGYWGSDRETAWLPREICDEIDAVFEDCYEAQRC